MKPPTLELFREDLPIVTPRGETLRMLQVERSLYYPGPGDSQLDLRFKGSSSIAGLENRLYLHFTPKVNAFAFDIALTLILILTKKYK